jgi:hypothetical protein
MTATLFALQHLHDTNIKKVILGKTNFWGLKDVFLGEYEWKHQTHLIIFTKLEIRIIRLDEFC